VTNFFGPLRSAIEQSEIIRGIQVSTIAGSTKRTSTKFTLRNPIDPAIVSATSAITIEEEVCADARIALGAAAPVRARTAKVFTRDQTINEDTTPEAVERALAGSRPLTMNTYMVKTAKALVKRAILR
jgi:carbon-monoxide dehydrogenase medium subunit